MDRVPTWGIYARAVTHQRGVTDAANVTFDLGVKTVEPRPEVRRSHLIRLEQAASQLLDVPVSEIGIAFFEIIIIDVERS